MYFLYVDYGYVTERLIWQGNSLTVGIQKFNAEKRASEKGDFDVLDLARFADDGEFITEKTFRF